MSTKVLVGVMASRGDGRGNLGSGKPNNWQIIAPKPRVTFVELVK